MLRRIWKIKRMKLKKQNKTNLGSINSDIIGKSSLKEYTQIYDIFIHMHTHMYILMIYTSINAYMY